MFWRMIKKDLRDAKGLNVIILLFMVIVSALASAGAMLINVDINGIKISQERCRAADLIIHYEKPFTEPEKKADHIISKIKEYRSDAQPVCSEALATQPFNIDFEGRDLEKYRATVLTHLCLISPVPHDVDLAYDQNNNAFYVENGTIAVPKQFASDTGLKVGDTLTITTPAGNVYEFPISVVHTDPAMNEYYRFFLSDGDYEQITPEFPGKRQLIFMSHGEGQPELPVNECADILISDASIMDDDYGFSMSGDGHTQSNATLTSVLVSFFLIVAGIFMMLIIAFALRFTIRSAIAREERELGIMKAIGTDTFSFRWLFAAKYIVFSITGGTVGAFLGMYAGHMLINFFYFNMSYSLGTADYITALAAALFITALVILFIMISMRRINKISVMQAIGDSRAESLTKNVMHLDRRKKMSIPLFLAVSDLLTSFRRYILLFIAFTLGNVVVLLGIQIKESVISPDFAYNYYTYKPMDFMLTYDSEFEDKMTRGTGRADIYVRSVNAALKNAGIPAEIETVSSFYGNIISDGKAEFVEMNMGFDPEGLVIRKGGQYPVLENEVLIDYFTAQRLGKNIGDSITLEYSKVSENGLSEKKVREDFVITGFVDRLSVMNDSTMIMSKAFNSSASPNWYFVYSHIDAPESEKEHYREMIKELFPTTYQTSNEAIRIMLNLYNTLFIFMRDMFIVVITAVLIFLTVMYQSIFMKEEESEIALLGACGIDTHTVKMWQLLRMMILFVLAVITAEIITPTLIADLLGSLFKNLLGLTGFRMTGGTLASVLWGVCITVLIMLVMKIVIQKVDKTEIWRIRNE